MSRLFITPREIDFINDISKEVIKDVVGQKIYLFPISVARTKVHDVYEEAINKIFDNPIEIAALVKWEAQNTRTNVFGSEQFSQVDVFISHRDMLDKGVTITEGDFFSFGEQFFEITINQSTHIIYGQIDHTGGIHLVGKSARRDVFVSRVFGPTDEAYSDPDAVQRQFVQERGFVENNEGPTNDVRDLQKNGKLDPPISGPAEVSPRGDPSGRGSSFYDDK